MPNMVITQPRNGHVLKELMESSFSWNRPAAIRYPNIATEELENTPLMPRELGKGEILAEGQDILLIGLGHMANTALQIRERLLQNGIQATVLDPVFVKPLDTELLCRLMVDHQLRNTRNLC
jgi:1-deoxy-D-xylulose-5-phosphate synthase